MALPIVRLTPAGQSRWRHGHPWIFARHVASWPDALEAGEFVAVTTRGGTLLGYAYANPQAPMVLRRLAGPGARARGGGVPDERGEWQRRLDRAWSRRRALQLDSDAFRLLWSESDGLPGVVCDVYADRVAVQFLTAGAERRREWVIDWLVSHLRPTGIFERSEGAGRRSEGLPERRGWIAVRPGQPDPDPAVWIQEGPLRYQVRLDAGHKTGFYLDQRAARRRLRALSLTGEVLDVFAYTGGCALAAAAGGAARVRAVESSAPALSQLRINAEANHLADRVEPVKADAFDFLHAAAVQGGRYEAVILDPPPLARRRTQAVAAVRAHIELQRSALRVLVPGGWLLTCSCSHAVGADALRASLAASARSVGRRLRTLETFGPDADHPERPQVPESRYLSCVLARAV